MWLPKSCRLALAVCLTALGSPSALRAAVPDKHLPDDTETVYGFNIRGILNAEIIKKDGEELVKRYFKKSVVGGWLELLAIDAMKEVESILAAEANIKVERPGGRTVYDALFLVTIKVDGEKLASALVDLERKVRFTEHAGVRIYERKVGEDAKAYTCFLNGELLAVANRKEMLQAAIDKEQGTKTTELKHPEIAAALERADERHSMWLACTMPGVIRDMFGNPPHKKPLSEHLKAMYCSATLKDNILFHCDMHCLNPDQVADVKAHLESSKVDVERFVSGNRKYRELWREVFKDMRISHKKDVITIRVEVQPELAPKFLQMWAEMQ